MAALSADRDTKLRTGGHREPPVKAATIIYAGALVAIDTSGRAVPASATSTLVVIGRAEGRFNNSTGADGDIKARVRTGIFRFDNSTSTDAFTSADVGKTAYAVDDHTVAKTDGSGARPKAGIVFDVDALGVWIQI